MFILSSIYNSFDDGEESILNFLCSSQASSTKKIGCTCQTQPNGFRLIAEDAKVSFCFVEKNVNLSFKMDGGSFSKRNCCDIPLFSKVEKTNNLIKLVQR